MWTRSPKHINGLNVVSCTAIMLQQTSSCTLFVHFSFLAVQNKMNKASGKSQSRGQKLAKPKTTVTESQVDNDEIRTSPRRKKSSEWTAHTIRSGRDQLNAQYGRNNGYEQQAPSNEYPDVTTQSSTPKDSNSLGLTRSASAGSAHKESHQGGLSRSASTGSAEKNSTPIPNNPTTLQVQLIRSASASSAKTKHPIERASKDMERQHSSSNKNPDKTNTKRKSRSPTFSDVDSPDDNEFAANNAVNGSGSIR